MAQTIFEIFDCTSGKTLGYRHTAQAANEICERVYDAAKLVYDYMPAKGEGYYCVASGRYVKAGPFEHMADAQSAAALMGLGRRAGYIEIVRHEL